MIVKATLDKNVKPTREQIEEIRRATEQPIVYDEDSPKLTETMKKELISAAKNRNMLKEIG